MLFTFDNLKKFLGFIDNNDKESKNSSSSLILKPPPDLPLLFSHNSNPGNIPPENNSDPENVMQNKYYDIDKL